MCLFPREEIKIAEEPISCVKIIGEEKRYLFGLLKFWRSPVNETNKNRKFRKVLTACKRLYRELDTNVINSGFHLYDNTSHAERSYVFRWDGKDIKPALIPKGSEYCLGHNNDIVANKILVFENEKQREKYLKRYDTTYFLLRRFGFKN